MQKILAFGVLFFLTACGDNGNSKVVLGLTDEHIKQICAEPVKFTEEEKELIISTQEAFPDLPENVQMAFEVIMTGLLFMNEQANACLEDPVSDGFQFNN